MFLDLILLKIAQMIWPDKPAITRGSSEDSANWIILNEAGREGSMEDCDHDESDPFLNGDYGDGPDW